MFIYRPPLSRCLCHPHYEAAVTNTGVVIHSHASSGVPYVARPQEHILRNRTIIVSLFKEQHNSSPEVDFPPAHPMASMYQSMLGGLVQWLRKLPEWARPRGSTDR